jgi:hypothetical protein
MVKPAVNQSNYSSLSNTSNSQVKQSQIGQPVLSQSYAKNTMSSTRKSFQSTTNHTCHNAKEVKPKFNIVRRTQGLNGSNKKASPMKRLGTNPKQHLNFIKEL